MGGISELAIVIVLASALGVAAKILKQPIVVAYLFAGLIIGYFSLSHVVAQESFQIFSELGIMFLLFLVGLEINYNSLRLVGKASVIVGLAQIFFTSLFGFIIAQLFGFGMMPSLYIAIALTFSSTVIVVQLLSEKNSLNSLHGKITIGFLLVQDLVAILILVVLSGLQDGSGFSWLQLGLVIFEGIALLVAMMLIGRKIMPVIFNLLARSQDLLFISTLAWLFVVVAVVQKLGFSLEIGGLIAGIALANSSEIYEITSKFKPLRDFFMVIFFVILGSLMIMSSFSGLIWPIIILSLFVLIGNPLIVLVIMGLMGYERRISFLTGVNVAQISEFSLILAALGLKIGHLSQPVVSLITAVGVITITASTYLIIHAEKIFQWLSPRLSIFERKRLKRFLEEAKLGRTIVLFGCHRTGQGIAAHFKSSELLIIDFDPDIVAKMKQQGYKAVFGDIADLDIFANIDFSKTRLIISTSPNLESNLLLINQINRLFKKSRSSRPKLIIRSDNEADAKILYKAGADYVLMPNFISGHYLGKILKEDPEFNLLAKVRKRDLSLLGFKL